MVGVALLALVALGVLWLAGQVLLGIGVFAVGLAGVLLRLLWFLLVAGALGGAVYFVSSAWRPAANRAVARRVAQTPGEQAPAQTLVASAVPELRLDGQAVRHD